MKPIDQRIRAIAARQYGVFSTQQSAAVGATPADRRHRRATGMWEQVVKGVDRLAGAPDTWRQRLKVALLVAGPSAAVSHMAAAALWRLPGFPERPVDVVSPFHATTHRLNRGRAHESRYLPDHHVRVIDGLKVTSIERTLCDLAGVISSKRLERAVENAIAAGLTSAERLWMTWAEWARKGRPGARKMHTVLLTRAPGYVATESELEARYLGLLESAGRPLPERQVNIGREEFIGRVDFVDREPFIVHEIDGRVGHTSELDRRRDRRRDNEITALGGRVMRFCWEEVVMRPDYVLRIVDETRATAAKAIPSAGNAG